MQVHAELLVSVTVILLRSNGALTNWSDLVEDTLQVRPWLLKIGGRRLHCCEVVVVSERVRVGESSVVRSGTSRGYDSIPVFLCLLHPGRGDVYSILRPFEKLGRHDGPRFRVIRRAHRLISLLVAHALAVASWVASIGGFAIQVLLHVD